MVFSINNEPTSVWVVIHDTSKTTFCLSKLLFYSKSEKKDNIQFKMQCLLFLSNSTPTTAPLKKSVFHNGAPLKNRRVYKSLFFFCLCPQVLHHMNEVGDGLCLKFSRQKYSPRRDLCDGIDYKLDSWRDLRHLLSTASVGWSLRAAGVAPSDWLSPLFISSGITVTSQSARCWGSWLEQTLTDQAYWLIMFVCQMTNVQQKLCSHLRRFKERKKKSRGASLQGTIAFRFQDEFSQWTRLCVFLS